MFFTTQNASAWNTPSISSPSEGSLNWVGAILNWNAVSNSTGYQVQVDTSASFNSPLAYNSYKTYINSSSGNSDTQDAPPNLLFGKTYYWRVRAYVIDDTSSWNNSNFITRDFVTQSGPLSESDQWTGVNLDWATHRGVSFYHWEADTSASFNSPASRSGSSAYINSTDGNSDTQFFLDDIYFGQTYYWRVRASNAVDTCSWSSVWSFNTRDFITLSSPLSESEQWSGLNLNWAPHRGVDFYDWQADTSMSFASPAFISGSDSYINSTDGNGDTQEFINNLYFGKTYYWRVRARNAVDTCSWSTIWNFNVRDFVNMGSPIDQALDVNVNTTFNWSPHAGIAIYQLQVDISNLFNTSNFLEYNKNYINSTDGNSDTQQAISGLLDNTIYFWRVRVINAVDTSAWTQRWFSTGNVLLELPPAPSLITENCGLTNQSTDGLILNWTSQGASDSYQLELINSSDSFSGNPTLTDILETSYSTGPLSESNYCWRVRAVQGNLASEWTEVCCFSIEQAVTAVISFVSQTSTCAGSEITVNFETSGPYNIDNVFQLELSNMGGNFSAPLVIGEVAGQSGASLSGLLPDDLQSGNYLVRIRANSPNFTSENSSFFSVISLPEILIVSEGGTEINCNVESIVLTASGGIIYSWNAGSSTNSASNTVNEGGTYSVTVIQNGCSAEQSIFISENTEIPAVSVDLDIAVCNTNGEFELTGGSPVGGTWSGESVNNGFFNPNGVTEGQYNPIYSFVGSNGCIGNASASINVDICTNIIDYQYNNIKVYPNLIQSGFYVDMDNPTSVFLQIFHSNGSLVLENYINTSTWIDSDKFVEGIYVIQLYSENGHIQVFKLIK